VKTSAIASLALSVILLTGCSSSPALEELKVAGVHITGSTSGTEPYKFLIEDIQESSELPVTFIDTLEYSVLVQGLLAGQVDIAVLDANNYVRAKSFIPDLKILGGISRGPDTLPGYYPIALVRADSAVTELSAISGKVCSVDQASTGTYIWPLVELNKLGLADGLDASHSNLDFLFTGDLMTSVQALHAGDCSLAFVVDTTYDERIPASDLYTQEEFRIIWTGPVVPGLVVVANTSVPDELAAKVSESLIANVNRDLLASLGKCDTSDPKSCLLINKTAWGLVSVDDSHYDPAREACRVLELEDCT
jgi:ABC-type phosphate/phosphonate transport system substrate-binding protein